MKLGLCSGAAPDAPLDALLDAAARRGLSAVELREGDRHGVSPGGPLIASGILERARANGIEVTGYREAGFANPLDLARLSRLLEAPILVDGSDDFPTRVAHAVRIAEQGARVAVVARGPEALHDARAACSAGLDLAWDAEPQSGTLGRTAASLLDELGPRLKHIRLYGGGPESVIHEGKGIGELAGRLALAGYDGTVMLTPASPRYRIAWEMWLGRRGGWGCGSRTAATELVTLDGAETAKGASQ